MFLFNILFCHIEIGIEELKFFYHCQSEIYYYGHATRKNGSLVYALIYHSKNWINDAEIEIRFYCCRNFFVIAVYHHVKGTIRAVIYVLVNVHIIDRRVTCTPNYLRDCKKCNTMVHYLLTWQKSIKHVEKA